MVKYFDSYKFESTSYHSIKFHFRSIDTWLQGICKSHCSKHSWSTENFTWHPGKKSVFSVTDDQYDQADLDAPDLDAQDAH